MHYTDQSRHRPEPELPKGLQKQKKSTVAISLKDAPPEVIRKKILDVESKMAAIPGALFEDDCAPLKHTFVDGAYVREITMPKGMLLTSKIHKICHPYFVLRGDVSVLTEKGVQRIKAPFSGVTQPGTKRILYMHEETVWATVHVTKETDLKKIEDEIIAKTFDDLPDSVKKQSPGEITEAKLIEFCREVQKEDIK